MKCRICGSTKNLKYTQAEIRGSQNKSKRLPLPLKEIANAINGNICTFCDLRLQNFHHEENDSSGIQENVNEVPIFVDDDERLYNIFYKRQQSEGGIALGSDGTEIIEVFTSREATPELTPVHKNNQNNLNNKRIISNGNTRVVDVIELEDDDDVDNITLDSIRKSNSLIKNIQQETRLLGCLSLITSDSDSEINFEPCRKIATKKEQDSKISSPCKSEENKQSNSNIFGVEDKSITIQHTFPVCQICGIRLLDTKTLEYHMKEHEKKLNCPVCDCQFPTELSLVYHIRKKHRYAKNIGSTLCESSKCSQDSAMTIRLRFEQSVNFYECQLCGFIDSQFKTHKEHIIHHHAYESKSLRDPMMKTKLKCPACQQKIGTHNIDICRHLLVKHIDVCAMYIKELKDYSLLGVSNKALQEIQYSARVLTLADNEERFYECQLCQKVFVSAQSFLRHLNGHNNDEWAEYKNRKSMSPVGGKKRAKRKTEVFQHKDLKLSETVSICNEKQQNNKKSLSPKDNKPSKNDDRMFKKPLKQSNFVEITSNKQKNEGNRQKKLKRRTKNNTLATKGIIKVKSKAPLRHFPTQKYNCKHCQIKGENCQFKGFRKLHLHMIYSHKADEFKNCKNCKCIFTSETALAQHYQDRHSKPLSLKRKRKYNTKSKDVYNEVDNKQVDENYNTENCCKQRREQFEFNGLETSQNQNMENPLSEPTWLKELYQLSREKKKKEYNQNNNTTANEEDLLDNFNISYQQLDKTAENICLYCACLLSEPLDILAHEKFHIESKDMPWIKFNRFK